MRSVPFPCGTPVSRNMPDLPSTATAVPQTPRTLYRASLGWLAFGGKQKVAKAYGVFMDEELNKKYHFFLDHPVRTRERARA